MMEIKKIGVIFPYAENYDSKNGGAIARWVYEVIKNSDDNNLIYQIFSASIKNDYGIVSKSFYGLFCCFVKYLERRWAKNRILDCAIYNLKKITCRDVFWILSILSKIKNNDIIIIHNRPTAPYLIRRLGFNGKILLHMHNSHILQLTKKQLIKLDESTDGILFCSNFLKNEANNHFAFSKGKCRVIYNGVYPKTVAFEKKDIILFAGRFIDDKGVVELVKAFQELKYDYPSYQLHLVGSVVSGDSNQSTPYYSELCSSIEKDASNIFMLGHVDHVNLMQKMAESRILAVPSKWKEPFGMVALEGYENQCKVVATKNGGMPEILSEQGFYCDCTVESIKVALINAINDKNIYAKSSEKFYWNNISNNFTDIIHEI